ncbi:protein kinase [Martiniozyma asiatica (nom. inval.)]|nr:protein kinase [Martiniozyma asiatica]
MISWKKSKIKNLKFPIYLDYQEFNDWIHKLTTILLYLSDSILSKLNSNNKNIDSISNILNNIPYLDLSVSKFVLPYALLFILITVPSESTNTENIVNEFNLILNFDQNNIEYEFIKEEWKKCVVKILELFQFLKAWLSKINNEENNKSNNSNSENLDRSNRVKKFLNNFDSNLLSKRATQCGMFTTSVFYLEKGFKDNKIKQNDFVNNLKDSYASIEDFDELQGVLKIFSTNNINDILLQFKYNDDQNLTNESLSAIAQYDFNEIKNNNELISNKKSIIQLLDGLNRNCEFDQLLTNLNLFQKNLSIDLINPDWSLYGLQASIFSGNYKDLIKWTNLSENFNNITIPGSDLAIYYEISKSLIELHNDQIKNCIDHINKAINFIGFSIMNSNGKLMNIKLQDYSTLLHGLYDFKLLANAKNKDDSMINLLKLRQLNSSKEFRSIWKLHSLRSSIYKLHPIKEIQNGYKNSLIGGSRILREFDKLPQATKLITKALILNDENNENFNINVNINNDNQNETNGNIDSKLLISVEVAHLFWDKGQYQSALKKISNVISVINKSNKNYLNYKLTHLKWIVESAEGVSDDIQQEYLKLIKNESFEKNGQVYYQFGNYLSKLLNAIDINESNGDLDLSVVRNYMIAIGLSKSNDNYIQEIFPKAITIWLDYYDKYQLNDKSQAIRSQKYQIMNQLMKSFIIDSNFGIKWYSVLSQVISRILHKSSTVVKNIEDIIVMLCSKFPSVIVYNLFALQHSHSLKRKEVGDKIISKLGKHDKFIMRGFKNSENVSFFVVLTKSNELLEKISKICSKATNSRQNKKILDLVNDFKFNMDELSCEFLAIPVKQNFDQLYRYNEICEFVTIKKFSQRVLLLSSLQRPKKIDILGFDGKKYTLLLKQNDDLRKDHKVMEFSNVMNRILKNNIETQKRKMSIQGYAATPLSESFGIIEWVNYHKTLRPILFKRHPKIQFYSDEFVKASEKLKKESDKIKLFNAYKDKFPPVLSDWIIDMAPNLNQWYDFRTNYGTSLAVNSMVGYIVGIGDRHLDNIMINETTGKIMHIDFDCIFEKGRNLPVPELVPFRMTQNVIDGLGILKCEGRFRKVSELTLQLVRQNEITLINFLESFIHDPLLDWGKQNSKLESKSIVYERLRQKIKGILTPDHDWTMKMNSSGLSVSVNLQVELLIQSATNDSNLLRMFRGWVPLG